MKRSEMLRTIEFYLLDENCMEEDEAKYQANLILSVLENKGMLPPAYTPEPFYHKESGKQLQLIDMNEWEKE